MIRLFKSTETNFTHNGIVLLDDIAISDTCVITNEINGVYSLEMELSICDNSKWKEIQLEMIIRVPTVRGEQLFRIKEIVNGFLRIKVYAKHIFFDLENNFILDTNIVQKDGRGAINQILGNMSNNMVNSYYGTSDISKVNNARLVRKNVVTSLLSNEYNSFINRWGGELYLDNFNFSLNTRIGADRGVQIRYSKNCTGYEGNINAYNLCTRIVPVGYNGIMLDGIKWVDSPNITKYPQIYTYEMKFDHIKVKENTDDEEGYNTLAEAQVALRQATLDYFIQTKCDYPSFSARVNFISLEKTEEYKDLKVLERVELGDDINVYLSKINVFASSRVVKTRYNFYTQKFIELEIGELKANTFKELVNLKDKIDLVQEQLGGNSWQDIINKSLDEATKLMEEGLKGSHVINMKNQIVIGDAPEIKDMINCIVINKSGIGFSNNGYLPDRLVSAMTIDGKINASCITTGQLNAALIKAGTMSDYNGNMNINLDNGTINFKKGLIEGSNSSWDLDTGVLNLNNKFKFDGNAVELNGNFYQHNTDGNKSVTIEENQVKLYDWAYTGDYVGGLSSLHKTGADHGQIALNSDAGNALVLGVSTRADENGLAPIETYVTVTDNGLHYRRNIYFYKPIGSKYDLDMFESSGVRFFDDDALTVLGHVKKVANRDILLAGKDGIGSVVLGTLAGDNSSYYTSLKSHKNDVTIPGNLTVQGAKNRAVNTEFGTTTQNAYETANPYFGDIGEGTLGTDGLCYIYIDPVMLATVNTKCSYQVFISNYGENESDCVRCITRNEDHFIVKGTIGLKFGWELKAKQKGYENNRLEMVKFEESENNTSNMLIPEDEIKYTENADNYLKNYERGLLNYE